MNRETLNNIIQETETFSKKIFNDKLEKVVLFGSYARGDFDPESDVDIAVFLNLEESALNEYYDLISQTSSELSLKYGIIISILLISNKTFQTYKDVLPFYRNLINEGKEYYGRS
jgi:predicted nucleotidyltransferase